MEKNWFLKDGRIFMKRAWSVGDLPALEKPFINTGTGERVCQACSGQPTEKRLKRKLSLGEKKEVV